MFICQAEQWHHYRDEDNYPRTRLRSTDKLIGETLDELYDAMAKYRIENEHKEYDTDDDWYDNQHYYFVEFGTIVEIASEQSYDKNRLEATQAWRDHAANEEEKARKKAVQKAAYEAEEAERRRQRDLQQLAELKAKYED